MRNWQEMCLHFYEVWYDSEREVRNTTKDLFFSFLFIFKNEGHISMLTDRREGICEI